MGGPDTSRQSMQRRTAVDPSRWEELRHFPNLFVALQSWDQTLEAQPPPSLHPAVRHR